MGRCPNPNCPFTYKYKPVSCPACNAFIGGNVPGKLSRAEQSREASPVQTKKPRVQHEKVINIAPDVFSVHTHQAHRTICTLNPKSCSFKACQDEFEILDKNKQDLTCKHIQAVLNFATPGTPITKFSASDYRLVQ